MSSLTEEEPPPADVVRTRLLELADRHAPRVSGPVARHIVRSVRQAAGSPKCYRDLWARPEVEFGPFSRLPAGFQAALADAVYREAQERTFTTGPRFHRMVHGLPFQAGGELARVSKRIRQRGRWGWHVGRALSGGSRLMTVGSRAGGRAWLAIARYAPFTRTSWLHALWLWAGVDPMVVGAAYVDGIPADPRVSPVHGPTSGSAESCTLVGVDFLTSSGQPVLLEANFNLGISGNRVPAYPAGDPICAALARYALDRGLRRIVHYPTSLWFYDEALREAWRRQMAALGIAYEVRDDPVQRSPFRRDWEPLMNFEEEGTLYVNSREIPSPLYTLLCQKGLLETEIERDEVRGGAARTVRVPRRIRSEADVARLDSDPRFPNLIVKHSRQDRATGHALWRTPPMPDRVRSPHHIMWEYVRPDRVTRTRDGEPLEFAYIYRTYLLITADGPRFAGARKVVSRVPIPSALDPGPVADIRPFVVNTVLAASAEEPSPSEMRLMEAATVEVGRVIDAFLRRKHRLASGSPGLSA